MSSKTLEQYLVAAIERSQIDHVLRASRASGGKVTFYVRPLSGDGETLDFVVRDNALVLNLTSASDVPESVLVAAQEARTPLTGGTAEGQAEIPKHPSHPDVPRPSDAELVELARGVCHAIEACGASPELTRAVTLASDLVAYLQKPCLSSEAPAADTVPHDQVMDEMRHLVESVALEKFGVPEPVEPTGAGSMLPQRAKVMTGSNFPKSIMKALGLPGVVQEFKLHVKKHAIVEVECRYFPHLVEDKP